MNSILECYLCSAMEIDFDDDIFSVPVILESHNTPMLDCILRVFLSKIRPLNLNVPGKHTITIDSSEFDQISPKDVFFKTLNIDIEMLKPGAPLSYESYYDNETSTKEVFNIYMRDYIDDPRKGYTLAKYFSHEIRHAYDDYIINHDILSHTIHNEYKNMFTFTGLGSKLKNIHYDKNKAHALGITKQEFNKLVRNDCERIGWILATFLGRMFPEESRAVTQEIYAYLYFNKVYIKDVKSAIDVAKESEIYKCLEECYDFIEEVEKVDNDDIKNIIVNTFNNNRSRIVNYYRKLNDGNVQYSTLPPLKTFSEVIKKLKSLYFERMKYMTKAITSYAKELYKHRNEGLVEYATFVTNKILENDGYKYPYEIYYHLKVDNAYKEKRLI